MRLLTSLVALLGAVSSTLAQTSDFHAITRPGMNEEVPAGKTYTITWNVAEKYEDEEVVIGLLGGDSGSSLHSLGTVGTTDGSAGEFTWKVDSSLGSEKTYGIVITLASDSSIYQYSTPFSIDGGASAATVTTSAEASETSAKGEPTSSTSTKSEKEKSTTTTESSTTSTSSTSSSTTSTTSTSSSESSSSSSSSTSSSSTTTISTSTFVTSTTAPPTRALSSSSTATATETGTPTSEPGNSGNFGGLPTGAWVGVGAGSIAGLAILLGMISMIVKMRRNHQERYRDIDRQGY